MVHFCFIGLNLQTIFQIDKMHKKSFALASKNGMVWLQPTSWTHLLSLKRAFAEKARLISGNSEVAVQLKFSFTDLPMAINPKQVQPAVGITVIYCLFLADLNITWSAFGRETRWIVHGGGAFADGDARDPQRLCQQIARFNLDLVGKILPIFQNARLRFFAQFALCSTISPENMSATWRLGFLLLY